jgi:type II secretory pathway pseudopilin PulG
MLLVICRKIIPPKHAMTFQRTSHSTAGLTFLEIMVVLGLLAMIAALAIPNLLRSRDRAQQQACVENLRQIEGAKQQWGAEQKKSSDDVPTEAELTPYFKDPARCPGGGAYTYNSLASRVTCSVPGHTL